MFKREIKNIIENIMDELPEHCRTVLVLRDVEGLDTAETAECLSISEKTVETRLHQARALMTRQLYAHANVIRHELFSFQKDRCDRVVAGVFKRISDSKS